MTDGEQTPFAHLRTLVHDAPSLRTWQTIIFLLEQWDTNDQGTLLTVALPYCEEHLARWDDSLRTWPGWWDLSAHLEDGRYAPISRLVRCVDLANPNNSSALATSQHIQPWTQFTLHDHFFAASLNEPVMAMLESPHSAGLEVLKFHQAALGEQDALRLAQSPYMTNLRILHVNDAEVTRPGLLALASSPYFQLEELSWCNLLATTPYLDFDGNVSSTEALSATDMVLLLQSKALVGLHTLDLSGDPLTGLTPEALQHTPSGLRKLTLGRCQLRPLDAVALATLPMLSALEHLNLRGNPLGDDGIGTILEPMKQSNALTSLDLSRTLLSSASIEHHFRNTPWCSQLRTLRMGSNKLGDAAVVAITQNPHLSMLSIADLSDTECGDDSARGWAERPTSRHLRTLDLSGNAIGDAGAIALAQSPHLNELRSLYLMNCPLTEVGHTALIASTNLDRCAVWIEEEKLLRAPWGNKPEKVRHINT